MAEADENKPKWREWLEPLFRNEQSEQEPDSDVYRLVKDAASRELFDEDTVKIIYGALQVSNMQARDIMVPRSNMVFLRISDSLDEVLDTFAKFPHSRFPVCGEDIDDIRGILHAKDLIDSLLINTRQNSLDLDELIRPPKVIPESKRLNLLLKDFRSERQHMALVIDEFTHVAGLITIEDVLEQIVGEIEDEHDPADDEDLIVELDDGAYRVKGETSIEEFNEYFKTNLSTEEFDTISGIITNLFGHVPEPDEKLEIDGFVCTVLNAGSRKVDLLKIQKSPS
ncbi:MAG: CBS domain-containing protein [Gammaproteobacteria bacterium]|nr:CBS domain-containing protein [Gammaproteobacteria bacterium]